MIKKTVVLSVVVLVSLLAVLVIRTLMVSPPDRAAASLPALAGERDQAAMLERLSRAITFPTVTGEHEAFVAFHTFLRQSFPRVHGELTLTTFGDSLLYHWDSGQQCPPVLLVAHQDVVPVSQPRQWQFPPFAGVLEQGYLWGRGTLDDKVSVMAVLEAVELMLAGQQRPACDVWLAFGHDEETGGRQGAQSMAAWLASRGLQFGLVLDEGGMILPGSTLGMERKVALIGIAEKGYVSIQLRATGEPGHSSRPPNKTAIGALSAAILALEDNPRPASLSLPARQMLEQVSPWQPFLKRLVFANLWLFEPLVVTQLASKPETNALIRTTMAPTLLQAGVKDNVLPGTAHAVVNFRLLPGETRESLLLWLKQTLPAGIGVDIVEGFVADPSPISPSDSAAFQRVAALAEALPGQPVAAPFLMIAGSDARHYHAVSDNVLRFLPVSLGEDDLARFHGPNERVAVAQYPPMVNFYVGVMQSPGTAAVP